MRRRMRDAQPPGDLRLGDAHHFPVVKEQFEDIHVGAEEVAHQGLSPSGAIAASQVAISLTRALTAPITAQ